MNNGRLGDIETQPYISPIEKGHNEWQWIKWVVGSKEGASQESEWKRVHDKLRR